MKQKTSKALRLAQKIRPFLERTVIVTRQVVLKLLNDKWILGLFEVGLLTLLLYSIARVTFLRGAKNFATAEVIRGPESWNKLYLAYGLASALTVLVINVSEAGKHYKVIISLSSLAILCYLFFYNGWFRNLIIGFIIKSTELKERF
jgi:hypothetical protein